jgi:hypothetical protein
VLDQQRLPLELSMATLTEAWCLGRRRGLRADAGAAAWAEAPIAALPGTRAIGELVAGEAGALGWASGEAWNQDKGRSAVFSGYSHFS